MRHRIEFVKTGGYNSCMDDGNGNEEYVYFIFYVYMVDGEERMYMRVFDDKLKEIDLYRFKLDFCGHKCNNISIKFDSIDKRLVVPKIRLKSIL